MFMFVKAFNVLPAPSLLSICRDASSYAQKHINRSPTKQLYNILDKADRSFINLDDAIEQIKKNKEFDTYKNQVFAGSLTLIERINKIKKMRIGNCEEFCLLVLDYIAEKTIKAELSENIEAYRAEISGIRGMDHSVIVVNEEIIIDPLWNRVYEKKQDYSGANVPVLDFHNQYDNGPRLYYVPFKENHTLKKTYALSDILELKRENTYHCTCC